MNFAGFIFGFFIAFAGVNSQADSTCSESRGGKLLVKNLFTVLNKNPGQQLPPTYIPTDLKLIPSGFLSPKVPIRTQFLRAEALLAYSRMRSAAAEEGVELFVRSAYRSFDDQCRTFALTVEKFAQRFKSRLKGLGYARRISAEPGRSQHQLGTTVDIVFKELNYDFSIEKTDNLNFRWLELNAHKFGFITSYPFRDDDHEHYGFNSATGYFFEPWHWRYVGVRAAQAFKESGQLPDVFLSRLRSF